MMTTNEATVRDEDWILADRAMRDVLGGDGGGAVRSRIMLHVGDLRGLIGRAGDEYEAREDAERFVDEAEQAGADGAWPGTYDRVQAFAESLHFAGVADELRAERGAGDSIVDEIGEALVEVVRRALRVIAAELVGERFDEA